MRAFQNWLAANPDIKAKNDQIARDLAASEHGNLTIEQARQRINRTPSDPIR